MCCGRPPSPSPKARASIPAALAAQTAPPSQNSGFATAALAGASPPPAARSTARRRPVVSRLGGMRRRGRLR